MVRIKFKQLKLLNSLETRLFWSDDDDIIFSSLQRQGSLIDCVFVRPIETVQRRDLSRGSAEWPVGYQ